MEKRDYYEVLGVSREAGEKEIRKAYRRLAMKCHPDRNPGDASAEERFKELAEAFEVLSTPEKKAAYDRYGHEGLNGAGRPGFASMDDIFAQFGDMFGDFFGFSGGARSRGPQKGASLRMVQQVSFQDAAFGTTLNVEVPQQVECESCDGSGAAEGTQPQTCGSCQGRGQVHHSQGFFTLTSTCPQCRGAGKVITDPCEDCHGRGSIEEKKELQVKVPPGVDTGTRIRIRGEGDAGRNGGPRGDLEIVLQVEESSIFQREGPHLHYEAEISFVQAVLGAEIQVPILEGEKALQIAPGTQPGDKKIFKNEGLQELQGRGRGDLIVHLRIKIPTDLNERQRELLEEYAEETGVSVKKAGFFQKMKEKLN